MSLYYNKIRYTLRQEQHHEFRVEIRLGNNLTNVDGDVTVDIYDANNTQLVTAAVAINDGTGIYYHLYQIPSDPTSGTWMITFSYAVGGKSSVEKQRFEVSSISPVLATPTDLEPTVDNIRNFVNLNKVVTDTKILLHIKVARVTIDLEKSYFATSKNVEEAVFFAACLTVLNVSNKENDNLAESTFADQALVADVMRLYKLAMRKVKRIFDTGSKFDVSAEVGDTRSGVL